MADNRSTDSDHWRAKGIRFRTAALTAVEPAFAARLLRLAAACERTAEGLEALRLAGERPAEPSWAARRGAADEEPRGSARAPLAGGGGPHERFGAP